MKKTLISCIFMGLFPYTSPAAVSPVVSLSLGVDRADVYSSNNITMIPPFQNSYIGSNHYDNETVYGLFIGAETIYKQNWALQLGLSYYRSKSFTLNGNVYQFADPAFNNLTYNYKIQSQRVLLESKLSHLLFHILHPYIIAGLGEAFNKANEYTETPITEDALAMAEPFSGKNTTSFTYIAGLGLDVDIGSHFRVGAGYRFVSLGNAGLGVTSLQSDTATIYHPHLNTNQLLVQLSYIG